MDDKDDLRNTLEFAEAVTSMVSSAHPHPCATGEVARSMNQSVRRQLSALAAGDGPAQVASHAYRQGWETIFGKKQTVGEA